MSETKTIKKRTLELTNVVKLTDNFDNQEWQDVWRGTISVKAENLSFSSALPHHTLKVFRGGILINVWLPDWNLSESSPWGRKCEDQSWTETLCSFGPAYVWLKNIALFCSRADLQGVVKFMRQYPGRSSLKGLSHGILSYFEHRKK